MGSLDGVIDTESGWIGSAEVVTVRFDENELSYEQLLAHAAEHGCTTKVWTTTDDHFAAAVKAVGDKAAPLGETAIRAAKESDQIYYLRQSSLRFLPLTPLQARRVNGAMYLRQDVQPWLSPRQLELAKAIDAALAQDREALDGLERPVELEQLDEYEAALGERLNG